MTKPRLDQGPDYERGFIDGMQHQMQSSVDKAVNRLAQPEQEPVGVVALDTSRPFVGGSYNGQVMPWSQAPTVKTVVMFKDLPLNTPLYTTPPQRPWVGLTDEERETATGWSVEHIEDFLKQKNGYAEDKNT